MQPLLSEEDMDAIDYDDESDYDLISTEMLEDIRDRSQSHRNVNKREARYKYVLVLGKYNRNGKES